jgi:hypothetical protein
MRFLNILIILGCLVGGYWLVSSIMGPGIDLTRRRKEESPGPTGGNPDAAARSHAHDHDWHLILDVPANASRREVEAAYKRRLAKAESSGDSFESIRLRRAYEAAIRHKA